MSERAHVVITGAGVICPLGVGREAATEALFAGRSGVGPIAAPAAVLPPGIAAEVRDFEPKLYVKPRKSLKVMSREIQFAFAAADMAWEEAALAAAEVDPERVGVVFGAEVIFGELPEIAQAFVACGAPDGYDYARWGTDGLDAIYPLWMLKYLPNMPACHIGIAKDARGPCNTICSAEVSFLNALAEGMRTIERGAADVMLVGATSSRVHPSIQLQRRGEMILSETDHSPEAAVRPFDRERRGSVQGEGAAVFVLERQDHAEARNHAAQAKLLAAASAFGPVDERGLGDGSAISTSIEQCLKLANVSASNLGHINAHGWATKEHDAVEAQALTKTVPGVPISALRGSLGSLGAAGGAVELFASLAAASSGRLPPTINCDQPEADLPIALVDSPPPASGLFIKTNHSLTGQSAAVLVEVL